MKNQRWQNLVVVCQIAGQNYSFIDELFVSAGYASCDIVSLLWYFYFACTQPHMFCPSTGKRVLMSWYGEFSSFLLLFFITWWIYDGRVFHVLKSNSLELRKRSYFRISTEIRKGIRTALEFRI